MEKRDNTIFVVGHKNPDTDSICSAIAYAELKRKITGEKYRAMRAGQVNAETLFVLSRFGIAAPTILNNVRTQVEDIEIRRMNGVKNKLSLKKAWSLMTENKVTTLPIVRKNGTLEGLITIGDITKSYMDVYDSHVLATARTPYINILETLGGTLVVGNEHAYLSQGKVLVAAANPDLMESYIEENDVVILGNRYESQLCAIEMNAQCIIICDGTEVSRTIQKLAQEKNCTIIKSPYDTFTVSRLINQSMPIKFFMNMNDLTTFTTDDYIDEVKDIMVSKRHRYFPVLDKKGDYYGMLSRRNLMNAKQKELILVDHNERSQAVDGLEQAVILEIIDHHRLGSIETMSPVFFRNQPLGCTATIIYQMYKENKVQIDPKIAGLLCSAIISDTLVYRSPTCTDVDREAAEDLAKIACIDVLEYAKEMFSAGSNLANKTAEQIFYQDFKKFSVLNNDFGVGQITSMDSKELDQMRIKLLPYLEEARKNQQVDMIFFMLTDIIEESTRMICSGNGAVETLKKAFQIDNADEAVILQGVVSRKKQLIPAIMIALHEDK